MDPVDYCAGKVAAEGSTGYYTVVFQPPSVRGALLALMTLERELQEVVEDCSEPAVAAHKLSFWREQLAQSLDGGGAHPVSQALSRHAGPALDAELMERLLLGVGRRIALAQVRSEDELDASCLATAGAVGEAMARIVAPGDPGAAACAAAAAAAVERVRLLRLPRHAGRPPHAGVPLDLLTGCGAIPSEVDSRGSSEPVQLLRRALLDRARARIAGVLAGLPVRRGLAATRLRLAMSEAAAFERGGYAARGEARAPLPIALLWAAWRSRPPSPG